MKKTYVAPMTESIEVYESLMKQFASGWRVDGGDKEGEVENPGEPGWPGTGGGSGTGGLIWGDND